jgi:putative ABC transport system permease protein
VARDLRVHASRTVLVVLAIAMGLIGAGSVLDTWSLVRQVTREEFLASNPASATLRLDAIDGRLLERVRAMPSIAAAQARRTVVASARTSNGWRSAILFALDDFTTMRIGVIKGEAGSWPPDDGAFVLEHSSAEFAGLGIGDSIELRLPDEEARLLPVTGVARDVGLAPGWMENVVYGFVTPSTLESLGTPSTLDELLIAVAGRLDRDEVRRVALQVKELVEASGHRVTSVDVPVPGRHVHAGQIDSLLYTQGAFGLLALLLSCMLVVNLISAMLAGQVREIGVMKAIGADQRQIAAMYLTLALVLGALATLIAIPVAAVIGRAYADFTARLLNFSTEGFEIPRATIALQIAVGLALPVAAAAIPVVRGCGISVGAALRDFGIVDRDNHGSGRLLGSVSGVSRPLLLSLRNAFRRRQRMTLTLLTLGAGGAVYLGAINLRAAIRGSVDLLFDTQRYDLVVRFARPWPAGTLERAIAAVPGVARAEAWSAARATVAREDGLTGNAFPVSAPPPGSEMLSPGVLQGRWLRAGDDDALVVNRRLVDDEPRLAPGATATLMIAGRPTIWKVVGVVETGPSPAAYAPRATIASMVSGGDVDRAVVRADVRGAASQLDLIQRLRAELNRGGLDVQVTQLMADNRKVVEDHLLMVASFLGIMGQLMIVVGGLGLASTMSLSVLERTREIGVLRAIGARHGSILTMVQVEGLVIALCSWLIALPLSIPMSVFLGEAFGRIMIRVPVILVPDAGGVLRWLLVVVAVSLVACLWPAYRAMRVPTATALSYE